jgi:hypothetical protein
LDLFDRRFLGDARLSEECLPFEESPVCLTDPRYRLSKYVKSISCPVPVKDNTSSVDFLPQKVERSSEFVLLSYWSQETMFFDVGKPT